MAAYMRGRFAFLGVPTRERRQATLPLLRGYTALDRRLVLDCFSQKEREFQYIACDHIRRTGITDLSLALRLVRTKSWWDTVDALAKPIGAAGDRQEMMRWAANGDFWVRRVAILHQLGRGADTDLDLLSAIIRLNLGSGEFFVDKAIGWALREVSRTHPMWVREFVSGTDLSPLSRREALRRLG